MPHPGRLGFLDRDLSLNLAWIAAAGAKVAPLLAIGTTMLGVLAALAPRASVWLNLAAISAAIACCLLLASIGCLVAAVCPRLSGPKNGLVFLQGRGLLRAELVRLIEKGATK